MKTQSNHLFKVLAFLIFVSLALLPVASNATASPSIEPDAPLSTAFTFQGQIRQGNLPVSGLCDFNFELYSEESGFVLPIDSFPTPNVKVTNGYFTQPIDFDVDHYVTGEERWLGVDVRCPAGSGNYTTLSKRQRLFPTPFSNYSRGVWDFGATGSMEAGTPRDYGPGWIFYGANGHRRDIIAASNGIRLAASPSDRPPDDWQFAITENGYVGIGTKTPERKLHVKNGRLLIENSGIGADILTNLNGDNTVGALQVVNQGNSSGILADTNGTYSGFFYDDIWVEGNCVSCSLAFVAINTGERVLEIGDVVMAEGVQPSLMPEGQPVLAVRPVTRGAVGVVVGRAVLNESVKEGETSISAEAAGGSIAPDDYLFIVTSGLAQVRVDTLAVSIEAGQRLIASDQAGQVHAQRTVNVDGVELAEAASVIGIALETQQPDQELIWMYVNPQ